MDAHEIIASLEKERDNWKALADGYSGALERVLSALSTASGNTQAHVDRLKEMEKRKDDAEEKLKRVTIERDYWKGRVEQLVKGRDQ